jgi:hypothetical protein
VARVGQQAHRIANPAGSGFGHHKQYVEHYAHNERLVERCQLVAVVMMMVPVFVMVVMMLVLTFFVVVVMMVLMLAIFVVVMMVMFVLTFVMVVMLMLAVLVMMRHFVDFVKFVGFHSR